MKLTVFDRKIGKKSDAKKVRREGNIPGILYGQEDGQPIYLKGEEFQAILRNMKPGLLATTVFELHDGKKTFKAIVKDIQYHVVTYAVQHIDFALLSDDAFVTLNVPIQVLGLSECVGVKLGGFLRQVIRALKVRCLPKDIPQEFTVDVRDLNIAQSKTLADIAIPSSVRPMAKMSEIAVIIGKKAGAA
ncbi:MAG: 50S ribosomal protein L25 [Chlamydiota bacterium]